MWLALPVDLTASVSEFTGIVFSGLTDSAGSIGFVLTLLVCMLLVLRIALPLPELLRFIMQLMAMLLISFATKSALKQATESPRPYTELLTQQLVIPQPAHFYKLTEPRKAALIDKVKNVSDWRIRHWLTEMNYSFPSGHTLFAAVCLVMFGGVFCRARRPGLVVLITAWASMIAYSRLWLGMHRVEDLIGSVVCVAVMLLLVPQFGRQARWLLRLLEKLGWRQKLESMLGKVATNS
ncbi:phosphatase PAP2 family protein [Vibrio sp.]|uniref:phosphatase PAP2 family protein n=1 Tax=Vibrio sp. TaxID=678 RepID=UPI003D0B6092